VPARFDLVITNGTLVSAAARRPADIGIADGRIAELGAPGQFDRDVDAAEVLDATSLHILPGVIDGHVHFREPGQTHKEDWLTGSRAAVHGGVTTVLDMPNTLPPTRTSADARAKAALADARSYCDFGLFGLFDAVSVGTGSLAELVTSRAVVGLKVFMGPTTGELTPPPDNDLVRTLELARDAGLRTAFHAESAATLRWSEADVAERSDPLAHLEGRPREAESEAIDHIGGLLSRARAAGHILHVSSADGIDVVRRWRSRGVDLTCEVTPHHLFLGLPDYERLGGLVKVNPPVRGEPDAGALLDALADGTIDCVASDHAPHAPTEKAGPDIRQVAAGVAGVETLLPLMLTAVDSGWLSLERLVAATSEAPARAWGLWPTKGSLEEGADADLVVVHLGRPRVIHGTDLHGMHPLTPFEDRTTHGAVVATIVRGRIVVRNGQLEADPGWGRPVV